MFLIQVSCICGTAVKPQVELINSLLFAVVSVSANLRDHKQAISAVSLTASAAVWLQVTPSVFSQEMQQSTEERFDSITEVHPPHVLELLDMASHHKVNANGVIPH